MRTIDRRRPQLGGEHGVVFARPGATRRALNWARPVRPEASAGTTTGTRFGA